MSASRLLRGVRVVPVVVIEGAVTPSESLTLLERGYTLQKFFPAESSGGAKFLKGIGAPLPEVSFMPTGGITLTNAPDYLALENAACLGGTWISPPAALRHGDFGAIAKLARVAASL